MKMNSKPTGAKPAPAPQPTPKKPTPTAPVFRDYASI